MSGGRPGSARSRHPRVRLGLRGRIVASFAVGACLLSLVLTVSVYTISRGYLVTQRERSAERQTEAHADFVRNLLANPRVSAEAVLANLDLPVDTVLLLRTGNRWFFSGTNSGDSVGPDGVRPGDVLSVDPDPAAPPEWITLHDNTYLAVGITLDDAGSTLYELNPVNELAATLRILRAVLIACGIATTLGGAGLGLWASRRVLAPLHELAGAAARIASGELGTRLAPGRDSDLQTIVDSFNAMVGSLQQRIERERRFVADVSHELRTPLTTLVTSAGVLARRERDLPDRSRRALELITAELDHLRHLLDDLLALARSEAGLHHDQPEPLSLRELAMHTLADSHRPADLLVVDADVVVLGRKLTLERALRNLLDNADRHGGGTVLVTVGGRDGEARIVVDDAGPGVPVDDRERIFERFATGHAGRRSADGSGTGIGLALVAATAQAHGGSVRCLPRPGGGARFVLTLPAADDAPAIP